MFHALRNLLRLMVITRTFARYDLLFPDIVADTAPALGWVLRRLSRRDVTGRPGERLAAALTELGPTFIKLGQTLATRSDLIGETMAADLTRLQDRLPPFPAAEARRTIEHELGRPIEAVFAEFADRPVAAASIAQVHFAVTTDGREVAVKVLRPGIERRFRRDIDLVAWLAELLETWWPDARRLRPREVVRLFADSTRTEMDLRMEAAAAAEFGVNFADSAMYRVPAVDWDRTARRVLTLERFRGVRFDDATAIRAAGLDIQRLLTAAAEALFNQVFRDGFFHADLHPGNMFVLQDGCIGVVDFGIMGRLDLSTRTYLADMLLGFLNRDYRRVALVHFRAGYIPPHQSVELFTQAVRAIGEPLHNKPLRDISAGRLLAQLLEVTDRFDMETQPQLLLLQKSMLTAEGVGRQLDPDVNIWELARPLIEDWMHEFRGPEARAAEAIAGLVEGMQRVPRLLTAADRAFGQIADQGLPLHPDTIARIADAVTHRRARVLWRMWWASIAVLGVLAIVVF